VTSSEPLSGVPGRIPEPLRHAIDAARAACANALQDSRLRRLAEAWEIRGFTGDRIVSLVACVTDDQVTWEPIAAMSSSLGATEDAATERFLLIASALDALDRLPGLPVSDGVKRLFCDEFSFYAAPHPEYLHRFKVGTASFVGMCKTASLRRFPAGQFDWEVSGIRRADIIAVDASRLLPALAFAAFRMRGLHPIFFSHLNWRRPNRSLLEAEANRSYYRMAQAMRLQPSIKGFAACSWFRSPSTHLVSPHLGWLSRVFLENGGFVADAGPDSPDSGVLHASRTRKRLYEAGEFRPRKGLVMWPRDAMIAWAAAHPEFSE
jgi:hypothetical protein